jgi:hypothetical protein
VTLPLPRSVSLFISHLIVHSKLKNEKPINAEAASNGGDSFTWWTKHACGTSMASGLVTAFEESSSGDSNAEREGLKSNLPSSPARQRMAVLAVVLSG